MTKHINFLEAIYRRPKSFVKLAGCERHAPKERAFHNPFGIAI
jgi:hypothetical protein